MIGDDPLVFPTSEGPSKLMVPCQADGCPRQPFIQCVHGWWCDDHLPSHVEQVGFCQTLVDEIRRLNGVLQTATRLDLEGAKVLLDEWKWRQDHCWTSLRQYSIAAVTVSIVPYVKSDLIASLGRFAFLFPILGWLIFFLATWLFASEYVRSKPVEIRYRQLLGRCAPDDARVSMFKNAVRVSSISETTIGVLLSLSAILSMFNVVVLNRLIGIVGKRPDASFPEHYVYLCCVSFIVVEFLLIGIAAKKWSRRKTQST